MTCEERRDLLMLYASGALDSEERRDLEQHVDGGCPVCAGALAEAEAVLSHLPLALPAVEPPARIRERLMERVAGAPRAGRGAEGAGLHGRPLAPTRPWLRPALAAAAAAAVVLVGGAALWVRQKSALEDRLARQSERIVVLEEEAKEAARLGPIVARQRVEIERLTGAAAGSAEMAATLARQQDEIERLTSEVDSLGRTVEERGDMIQQLRREADNRELRLASYSSPAVRVFSLRGTESASRASARVFWDTTRERWDFYATNLEDPGIAKTYQLWFITAGDKKISAGTFDVVDGQAALLDLRLPRDAGSVVTAAVTDEPIGGSLQPSGSILLVGQVPRS